jgi:hypothetical protein
MRGLIAAKRQSGPVVVVAMGGFVAAPAAQAARAERVPVVLVNLDAVPGRANRWIARHARRVLTAAKVPGIDWEYVRPIIRRSAMAPGDRATCRHMFQLDAERSTLLVTGASLGARTINEFMLAWLERHGALLRNWQVIHQTGQGEHDGLRQAYERAGVPALVVPFLDTMGAAWGAADLAVLMEQIEVLVVRPAGIAEEGLHLLALAQLEVLRRQELGLAVAAALEAIQGRELGDRRRGDARADLPPPLAGQDLPGGRR